MTYPSIRLIAETTADFYGLRYLDLISHRRTQSLLRPRQVAMYLARKMTPQSLPEIGQRLGGRDHTTILHGCRRIAAFVRENADLAEEVDAIEVAVTAAVTAGGLVGVSPPRDLDPHAIAARVLDDPRGFTAIGRDQLVALAMAVRSIAPPAITAAGPTDLVAACRVLLDALKDADDATYADRGTIADTRRKVADARRALAEVLAGDELPPETQQQRKAG